MMDDESVRKAWRTYWGDLGMTGSELNRVAERVNSVQYGLRIVGCEGWWRSHKSPPTESD